MKITEEKNTAKKIEIKKEKTDKECFTWWNNLSEELGMENRKISLHHIKRVFELRLLNCCGLQIKDLSPLVELKSLIYLNCWGTQISDLNPLKNLKNLRHLRYPEGVDTSCIKHLIESGLNAITKYK